VCPRLEAGLCGHLGEGWGESLEWDVDRDVRGAHAEVEEFRREGPAVGMIDSEPRALRDLVSGRQDHTHESEGRYEPASLVLGHQHESILDRIQDIPESAGLIGRIERVKLTLLRHQSVQVHYIQRSGTTDRGLLWHCSHLGPLGTRKSGVGV
jgi:hypothetical protein